MFESCRAHQPNFVGLVTPRTSSVTSRLAFRSSRMGASRAGRTNLFNPISDCHRRDLGFVNKSEQFAADLFDGLPHRSIQHLRVHVQRRIDVRVTPSTARPPCRARLCRVTTTSTCVGTPARSPEEVPQPRACREHVPPQYVVRGDGGPQTRGEREPVRLAALHAGLPLLNQRRRGARSGICLAPASVFGVLNTPS